MSLLDYIIMIILFVFALPTATAILIYLAGAMVFLWWESILIMKEVVTTIYYKINGKGQK